MIRCLRLRFLVVLGISAVIHAVVIGLIRFPEPESDDWVSNLEIAFSDKSPGGKPPVTLHAPLREKLPKPVETSGYSPSIAVPSTYEYEAVKLEQGQVSGPMSLNTPTGQPLPSQPAVDPIEASSQPPHQVVSQSADTDYYSTNDLDSLPQLLEETRQRYPSQALKHGISGYVRVSVFIEADGTVGRAGIVAAAPDGFAGGLFKEAALDWARTLRFIPAKKNGLPVPSRLHFQLDFDAPGTDMNRETRE